MKVLKFAGIFLVILFLFYLALAFYAPTSLKIEESTIIDAEPEIVYPHVACFKNWEPWNPWDAMDSTNVNEFSEQLCGVGSWYAWKGEKTGTGRQEIVDAKSSEYIKCQLVFGMSPSPQISEWFFTDVEEGTKVTWNYIGTETPFFQRPMNLIGKYFLTEAYKSGLKNLKSVVESVDATAAFDIKIQRVKIPTTNYLVISGEIHPSEIADFYTENFAKILDYATAEGAEMSGYPSGFYYTWSDTLTKMAAAIPVNKKIAGNDEIEFRAIAEGDALQVDHYGAYDQTGSAHYAIEDYANENGLELMNITIEKYVTDPGEEPDTSEWLTEVVYPLAD
jgi:effector-binding domain-containing protein